MWSNNGPQVPDTHNAGVEKIIIVGSKKNRELLSDIALKLSENLNDSIYDYEGLLKCEIKEEPSVQQINIPSKQILKSLMDQHKLI